MKYLILGLLMAPQVHAESKLHCAYQLYGTPVVDVVLQMRDENTPGGDAVVAFQGARPVSTPVTTVTPSADEKIHVWLGKDDPNADIEMILYRQPRSQGQSKLVNPQMPFGKELWGNCN